MSHPRIKWSHRGMVVIDVPKEILQSALASVGSEHPASLGSEIESLYVELRGLGVPVVVEIDPRRSLKHGCGKAYSTAQWEALPSFNQPVPCIGMPQTEVDITLKLCGCGSHVGMASMELVYGSVEQPRQESEVGT